jgi:hypothetical protein
MENDDMPLFKAGDLVYRHSLSNGIPAVPDLALVTRVDDMQYAIYSFSHKKQWWCSHSMRYEYCLVQEISRGGQDV